MLHNHEKICTCDGENCAPEVRNLCKKTAGYGMPVAPDGAIYTGAVQWL